MKSELFPDFCCNKSLLLKLAIFPPPTIPTQHALFFPSKALLVNCPAETSDLMCYVSHGVFIFLLLACFSGVKTQILIPSAKWKRKSKACWCCLQCWASHSLRGRPVIGHTGYMGFPVAHPEGIPSPSTNQ